MTYADYAELMLGISEEEFTDVREMFPQESLNASFFLHCNVDSTKEDLIREIIISSVDPASKYIDDIEITGTTIKVWEHLDLDEPDLEQWRNKVQECIQYSGLKVEFHA